MQERYTMGPETTVFNRMLRRDLVRDVLALSDSDICAILFEHVKR